MNTNPGYKGTNCDEQICTPADCNWDELKPHGECIYNAEGDMSNEMPMLSWMEWYCLRNTDDLREPGSACDQNCSSRCLDDFPNICRSISITSQKMES